MNEHEKAREIAEGIADEHLGPFGAELEDDIAAALQAAAGAERERWFLALHAEAAKFDAEAAEIQDSLPEDADEDDFAAVDAAKGRAQSMRSLAAAIRGKG